MIKYEVHQGDALAVLRTLPDASVQCCVTSPPYYGLRDYGVDGQIGLEETPEQYINRLVEVFREVKRVLRDDGTLWVNIGDSYAASSNTGGTNSIQGNKSRVAAMTDKGHKVPNGCKPKDIIGIPWMLAFALRADGWYLRQDIIWHKPNPMPESVNDRCTKSHEYVFLMSKSARYHYDAAAIAEDAVSSGPRKDAGGNAFNCDLGMYRGRAGNSEDGTRNRRDVWTIPTQPCKLAHFAVMPLALATPCILAGCPEGGTVLDPFAGAGTTILAALQHDRRAIGIELNPVNVAMIHERIQDKIGFLVNT